MKEEVYWFPVSRQAPITTSSKMTSQQSQPAGPFNSQKKTRKNVPLFRAFSFEIYFIIFFSSFIPLSLGQSKSSCCCWCGEQSNQSTSSVY